MDFLSSYSDRELAILREHMEVENILAEACGYSYSEEYGWATGDHNVVSLAMEVRRRGVMPEARRQE